MDTTFGHDLWTWWTDDVDRFVTSSLRQVGTGSTDICFFVERVDASSIFPNLATSMTPLIKFSTLYHVTSRAATSTCVWTRLCWNIPNTLLTLILFWSTVCIEWLSPTDICPFEERENTTSTAYELNWLQAQSVQKVGTIENDTDKCFQISFCFYLWDSKRGRYSFKRPSWRTRHDAPTQLAQTSWSEPVRCWFRRVASPRQSDDVLTKTWRSDVQCLAPSHPSEYSEFDAGPVFLLRTRTCKWRAHIVAIPIPGSEVRVDGKSQAHQGPSCFLHTLALPRPDSTAILCAPCSFRVECRPFGDYKRYTFCSRASMLETECSRTKFLGLPLYSLARTVC